ncbi:hypothetical protein QR680_001153 [Steinernema hermaphroditum]|uniref:Uncharacterized protein n=1 Tax=Steinernema hermaphroditum TaxID=289476 RepID=A0AA39GZ36_9BILA|nr:hypothetical protein QR680_001153 [Steinernema hermaphroditum]
MGTEQPWQKGALNEEGVTPRRRGETSLNDEKAGFRMEHRVVYDIDPQSITISSSAASAPIPLRCSFGDGAVELSSARLCPTLVDSIWLLRIIS